MGPTFDIEYLDNPTVAHGKARETTKQTWLRVRLEVDFSAPGDLDFSG